MNMPNETINLNKQRFITLDEAAKIAGKGKSTIRRWRREGLLSKHQMDIQKKNSPICIDKNELLALMGSSDMSKQQHNRPTVIDKTVSIDMLKSQIKQLQQDLELSIKREQVLLSIEKDNRLSTEKKDRQIDSLTSLLSCSQNDLRLAYEQIRELTDRQEKLTIAAALYQAECEKGFFGRLFTKAKQVNLLPGPIK
jgi:hypothetical protein